MFLSKRAKDEVKEELIGTPEVEIDPGVKSYIHKAIDRLKTLKGGSYFNNVARIMATSGSMFGAEESNVIYINLAKVSKLMADKIKNINLSPEDYKQIFTLIAAIVLAHEVGHANNPDAGEGPALSEEQGVQNVLEPEIVEIIKKYHR